MDYQTIRRELLVALRGRFSQAQVNRKLGYKFNQVYRWEAGMTGIPWPEFLCLARACKIDVASALRRAFHYYEDPNRYDLFIRRLVGNSKAAEVARLNGFTPYRVRRWLNGVMPPDLDDVLSIIDRFSHVLIFFLGLLTDVSRISPLREEYKRRQRETEVLRAYPVSGAVLRALETGEYQALPRHEEGWISKKIGISLAEERAILGGLRSAGLAAKKQGRYRPLSVAFDPQGDFAAGVNLRLYWLHRARRYLEAMKPPQDRDCPTGQLVFSCSVEAQQRIITKYAAFFNEIRAILAADEAPPDRVYALGVQLLDVSKV
ncbi:MAG: DUF4423 domain-containing protein [Bdellovibrionales bacterium]